MSTCWSMYKAEKKDMINLQFTSMWKFYNKHILEHVQS